MWFISAVGLSGGIAFHEKTIVLRVQLSGGRFVGNWRFPRKRTHREWRHEEEEPVRQRRRRRVPGRLHMRVRRVWHARVVGQRPADYRRQVRSTRSLAALLQVAAESPGI